jgi:hypothetical protein
MLAFLGQLVVDEFLLLGEQMLGEELPSIATNLVLEYEQGQVLGVDGVLILLAVLADSQRFFEKLQYLLLRDIRLELVDELSEFVKLHLTISVLIELTDFLDDLLDLGPSVLVPRI